MRIGGDLAGEWVSAARPGRYKPLFVYRRRSATVLLLPHFVAFEAVAVIYWAHSRHRYYLDPLLAIAACAMLAQAFQRLVSRGDSAS